MAVLGTVPFASCEPVLAPGLVLFDAPAAVGEFPPPPQAASTREPVPRTSVETNLRRIVLQILRRVEATSNSLD
ncbi:hypothetical protein [Caballeronia fortuita]|uniref:hypothetical protein n=1 Tax=Caballeronia fortuita TaxID=1777138 RepID=UPI001FC98499|nr:hypothetical protein [Caballeronia fortuita]